MTLRTKKSGNAVRDVQRIPLPHNSAFTLGMETNRAWLHGIRADKRPLSLKSTEELAYEGERISLTFRCIGTFLKEKNDELAHRQGVTLIWGQGARGKTREGAQTVTNGGEEAERLLAAFGEENKSPDFDWSATYGEGFNVLHLSVDEGECPDQN